MKYFIYRLILNVLNISCVIAITLAVLYHLKSPFADAVYNRATISKEFHISYLQNAAIICKPIEIRTKASKQVLFSPPLAPQNCHTASPHHKGIYQCQLISIVPSTDLLQFKLFHNCFQNYQEDSGCLI